MGRSYAGILGSLATATVLARGWLSGVSVDAALVQAWMALLVFAPLGAVLGWLAERAVDQSVQQLIDTELEAQKSSRGSGSSAQG